MANYVRKIAISDYTFLEKEDCRGLFQIITCLIRKELGINHTCFVPKDISNLRDFYRYYYNRAISNLDLTVREYNESCLSSHRPIFKEIKVLSVECLDQNITINQEYRDVLDSAEFAEWRDQYVWNEESTTREIKELSIKASLALLKILKKSNLV